MHDPSGDLRVTFLGTGTSVGIPVITCDCGVCASPDPRNRRLRAGLLLEWAAEGRDEPASVLVDTTTDLRQQALRAGITRVDAVLYTHAHADHVLGLDELRIFNFVHGVVIPLYGASETLTKIRGMFRYAFDAMSRGAPRLSTHDVDGSFELLGASIRAIPVRHGRMTVLAYRIGGFGYVTDCNGISEAAADALTGLDVLVIDALRRKPHPTHFALEESLAQIERLRPRRAFLTHLGHDFDHATLEAELPDRVRVAHDGLTLRVPIGASAGIDR
jgi:phosphoribosyl 1,2-cyclic phosphate phosphodiesterase